MAATPPSPLSRHCAEASARVGSPTGLEASCQKIADSFANFKRRRDR